MLLRAEPFPSSPGFLLDSSCPLPFPLSILLFLLHPTRRELRSGRCPRTKAVFSSSTTSLRNAWVMQVVGQYGLGLRLVQACLEAVAGAQLAKRGLSLEESESLTTPRFLGIDEFARCKGHRYGTILRDLESL